ncbi:hypothetical protein [Streptomyces sp. NPDC052036]|uniref:hypothetical protein n=1 Tax=unclassified Streptomyces TaxID=2593676 RepID=UPI00342AEA18
MNKSDYFDERATVEWSAPGNVPESLAELSRPYPILRYAQVLKEIRKLSSGIGNAY